MYAHERSLVQRLAGEPFALVGVNSDSDLEAVRRVVREQELAWPSFWNGPEGVEGPIAKAWNVTAWPTVFVLDHEGVIRSKNVRGEELDRAVDALLPAARAARAEHGGR